jgi:hypothetical protein
LFYLGKLIVQQSFQPPAYFVIFSDEFKFTYKTVSSSQTKHLAVFSHDALKPSALCGSNPSALLALTMACARDVQKISVPAVQASSFGSWFRLAENIGNDWSSISDVLVLSKAIALT